MKLADSAWRMAKGYCVTRDGSKMCWVTRDGSKMCWVTRDFTQAIRVMRDRTSQYDARFAIFTSAWRVIYKTY